MEEARSSAGGGGDSSSRAASSFEKVGDRTRFTIELRPGETTIVSWKKLMKDASRASGSAAATAAASVPEPPSSGVHPALESHLAPGQPSPNELKDAAPPNRFNTVIEKIERLYMGKDSSDDEDLDDTPIEDQYDTEYSFIDDTELDEYFEVDKLKTKHDGFFVNRGELESMEPSLPPIHQPKKRRRKEMGTGAESHAPNKNLKMGTKGADKTIPSVQNNSLPASLSPSGSYPLKMVADNKPMLDAAASLKVLNGDAAKVLGGSLKEAIDFSDSGHIRYYEKSGSTHLNIQSGNANNGEELEILLQQREKNGNREQIDLNVAAGKHPIQNVKSSHCHKREGSGLKSKGNVLDKAIRELEKMVAESRPPSADFQDRDGTYQGTKRRLPQEMKQKLANVARAAQMSHGKVSQELLNRLMSILGHLINLRTLKRNLKIMINTNLSVNQEKDYKSRQIKKEVVEMINACGPSQISKATEQQPGSSDDFQESHPEEKAPTKAKYLMDAKLEDKLCDLYDIFIDGLDDDVAPQAGKLYAELAELWPKGFMDNHGIKRAICQAKERRRTLQGRNKDQERIKRKKLVATTTEEMAQADSASAAQPQYMEGGVFGSFGAQVTSYQNKLPSSIDTNNVLTSTTSMSLPLSDASLYQNYDWSKHEKVKGASTGSHSEVRIPDETLVKKKVKKKPETNLGEVHTRPEKVSQHSDERQKPPKQQAAEPVMGVAPRESSFQLAATPSFEQLR